MSLRLSDLSIRNPVFAVMVSFALVIFGWMSYRTMGISQFPEVDFPVVSVVINREAAPPEIMDGDVSDVVEDAIASVEGVDSIQSQSSEGTSIVTVYFKLNRDVDAAMQDVQNAVASARRRLPVDIDPPIISKVNPNNLPVIWLTLAGPFAPHKLSDLADRVLKSELSSLYGVGGIQFAGLQARSMRLWIDPERLEAFALTAEDIRAAIQSQHAELPAGYIKSNQVEFNLRTMGEASNAEEFRRLVVARRNDQTIHLGDVAILEDGGEDRRSLARFNRLPAVALGVRKAIGGNLVEVCDSIQKALPRLRKLLPEGVELAVSVDSSEFVKENIHELQLTLILGVLLTSIVCYAFLGSFATTLNICLTIPTSLLGTFFFTKDFLGWFGLPPFTLNLMTLLALSLSVGVVVDDAILVLENIHRHEEKGETRRRAAKKGTREIQFAAMAATLSIVAIFLPVAFMTGVIGRFFFQFGVTVAVAVSLSLLCSLTLTPMLAAYFPEGRQQNSAPTSNKRWLKWAGTGAVAGIAFLYLIIQPNPQPWTIPIGETLEQWAPGFPLPKLDNSFLCYGWLGGGAVMGALSLLFLRFGLPKILGFVANWIIRPILQWPVDALMKIMEHSYGGVLRWSLAYWPFVITMGILLTAINGWFFTGNRLGRELVPSEDQSRILFHATAQVGTNINQMSRLLADCEQIILENDAVESVLSTIGTDTNPVLNEGDLFVRLKPRRDRSLSQSGVIGQLRENLSAVQDLQIIPRDQSTEGFTAQQGYPIDLALIGPGESLGTVSKSISRAMEACLTNEGQPLFADINTDFRSGMPEIRIRPDREKLAMMGLPIERLATSISLLVGGERVAKFTNNGRRYDVRMRLLEQDRDSPDRLRFLPVRLGDNQLVRVEDLIEDLQHESTLQTIRRHDHQRCVNITANPAAGISQGDALVQVRKIANEILPTGYQIVELGNAKAMEETISSLGFALLLGIFVAYMILGVQFNSLIHPVTVLMAMPFAVTGALATLWLTGDTLNMMSMIGLVLLMGLVKKNSIILVDYAEQARLGGKSARNAVLAAGPLRLRPILMTSIATIAGAIPAAIGLGPGAETRAPMARAIIGGILVSTLVSLIFVPVFYVLMEDLRGWLGRIFGPNQVDNHA